MFKFVEIKYVQTQNNYDKQLQLNKITINNLFLVITL